MKKVAEYLLIMIACVCLGTPVRAQIHAINQNFDVACVLDANFPGGWVRANVNANNIPKGQWNCTPEKGRPNAAGVTTPGMCCTGYFDGDFHADTAFLVLPKMNLESYAPNKIYLQLDAKTNTFTGRSDLSIFVANDDVWIGGVDIDPGLISPKLSSPTDTLWHTYQVELTGYESSADFYIGLKYISTTGHGSIWFLDNVILTPYKTGINNVLTEILPMTVIGNATSEQVKVSYSIKEAGQYDLVIYDLVGRQLYKEVITAKSGISEHTISGLHLPSGMYCIKMGNENNYGTVKAVVQ
ncbi:MAG: C-terminal target protein [Flavipsychrobacter sp.]|nr:C-terminal target protein [Flavipsychrobacter sp.]